MARIGDLKAWIGQTNILNFKDLESYLESFNSSTVVIQKKEVSEVEINGIKISLVGLQNSALILSRLYSSTVGAELLLTNGSENEIICFSFILTPSTPTNKQFTMSVDGHLLFTCKRSGVTSLQFQVMNLDDGRTLYTMDTTYEINSFTCIAAIVSVTKGFSYIFTTSINLKGFYTVNFHAVLHHLPRLQYSNTKISGTETQIVAFIFGISHLNDNIGGTRVKNLMSKILTHITSAVGFSWIQAEIIDVQNVSNRGASLGSFSASQTPIIESIVNSVRSLEKNAYKQGDGKYKLVVDTVEGPTRLGVRFDKMVLNELYVRGLNHIKCILPTDNKGWSSVRQSAMSKRLTDINVVEDGSIRRMATIMGGIVDVKLGDYVDVTSAILNPESIEVVLIPEPTVSRRDFNFIFRNVIYRYTITVNVRVIGSDLSLWSNGDWQLPVVVKQSKYQDIHGLCTISFGRGDNVLTNAALLSAPRSYHIDDPVLGYSYILSRDVVNAPMFNTTMTFYADINLNGIIRYTRWGLTNNYLVTGTLPNVDKFPSDFVFLDKDGDAECNLGAAELRFPRFIALDDLLLFSRDGEPKAHPKWANNHFLLNSSPAIVTSIKDIETMSVTYDIIEDALVTIPTSASLTTKVMSYNTMIDFLLHQSEVSSVMILDLFFTMDDIQRDIRRLEKTIDRIIDSLNEMRNAKPSLFQIFTMVLGQIGGIISFINPIVGISMIVFSAGASLVSTLVTTGEVRIDQITEVVGASITLAILGLERTGGLVSFRQSIKAMGENVDKLKNFLPNLSFVKRWEAVSSKLRLFRKMYSMQYPKAINVFDKLPAQSSISEMRHFFNPVDGIEPVMQLIHDSPIALKIARKLKLAPEHAFINVDTVTTTGETVVWRKDVFGVADFHTDTTILRDARTEGEFNDGVLKHGTAIGHVRVGKYSVNGSEPANRKYHEMGYTYDSAILKLDSYYDMQELYSAPENALNIAKVDFYWDHMTDSLFNGRHYDRNGDYRVGVEKPIIPDQRMLDALVNSIQSTPERFRYNLIRSNCQHVASQIKQYLCSGKRPPFMSQEHFDGVLTDQANDLLDAIRVATV